MAVPRIARASSRNWLKTTAVCAERSSARGGECHRLAGELNARLRYGRIEDIFQRGLHEFLTEYIDRTIDLGEEIEKFYFN